MTAHIPPPPIPTASELVAIGVKPSRATIRRRGRGSHPGQALPQGAKAKLSRKERKAIHKARERAGKEIERACAATVVKVPRGHRMCAVCGDINKPKQKRHYRKSGMGDLRWSNDHTARCRNCKATSRW